VASNKRQVLTPRERLIPTGPSLLPLEGDAAMGMDTYT